VVSYKMVYYINYVYHKCQYGLVIMVLVTSMNSQGDHSPDNVKFPDTSLTVRGTQHVNCSHIMPVLVLLSVVGIRMQQYMIQNNILNNKTQQTPTKYLYGHKHAVYNTQF